MRKRYILLDEEILIPIKNDNDKEIIFTLVFRRKKLSVRSVESIRWQRERFNVWQKDFRWWSSRTSGSRSALQFSTRNARPSGFSFICIEYFQFPRNPDVTTPRYHKHCKTTEKCTHIYQTVCSQDGYEQTCSQARLTAHTHLSIASTCHHQVYQCAPCFVPGSLADLLPRDSVP